MDIVLVISDNPKAKGLQRAKEAWNRDRSN